MDPRPDISDKLVHFTSGGDWEEAFARLCTIVEERRVSGGTGKIRGGYRCVCFTEAPLPSLQHGLVNPTAYTRYRPFGIVVDKTWLFERGGRPVLYQSNEEYEELPDDFRWRHVRYEPHATPAIDYTWEREWRIKTGELKICPSVAGLVVPARDWAERLIDAHNEQQEWLVQEYSLIFDRAIAEQYREEFPWRIFVLR